MNAQGKFLPAVPDDTIEIVLSAEEMRALEKAAEAAEFPMGLSSHSSQPPLPSWQIPSQREEDGSRRRSAWRPIVKVVGCTAAYAVFAWWGASILAERKAPTAVVVTKTAAAVLPRPALLPVPQPPVVQVRNPFDATEVFEFPAGTTDADRREKVAKILLQRARDRRAAWTRVNPKVTLRTANLHTGKS